MKLYVVFEYLENNPVKYTIHGIFDTKERAIKECVHDLMCWVQTELNYAGKIGEVVEKPTYIPTMGLVYSVQKKEWIKE